MKLNKYNTGVAVAIFLSAAVALPAFAAPAPTGGTWHGEGREGGMRGKFNGTIKPGVAGTVSIVSGNIITINGRQGFGTSSPSTSFTIDATNALVMKNNATSSVSQISVGDTIFAQGTISGTNVVAAMIRDGIMQGRGNPGMMGGKASTSGNPGPNPGMKNGFFSKIGQFFMHFFGR